MARYGKIYLGPAHQNEVQTVEGTSEAAVLPGTVMVRVGAELAPHSVAGAGGEVFVADHNYLGGGGIDDEIPGGDTVMGIRPQDSQELAARCAAGADIAVGDPLASDGDGALVPAAAGDSILFFAQETYENTGATPELIRVRRGYGTVPAPPAP